MSVANIVYFGNTIYFIDISVNPFQTNGIFHKATYDEVKMVHCIIY